MRKLVLALCLTLIACALPALSAVCTGDDATSCTEDADCSGVGGICVNKISVGVPVRYGARLVALCEDIRVQNRRRTFPNPVCARFLIFTGAMQLLQEMKQTEGNNAARAIVASALSDFNNDFPLDLPPRVNCGDGILDTEFGEACDDGNEIENDGCTGCQIDP